MTANACGLVGYDELFLCGNNKDFDRGVVIGDNRFFADGGCIAIGIKRDAHELQPFAGTFADVGRIFADAGGEDKDINATHSGGKGAN